MSALKLVKGLFVLGVVSSVTAGCGRFSVAACEQPERYDSAIEAAPVQVPEGLTPPDESRALQIPGLPAETKTIKKRGECLESPPEYFEDGLPT